MSQENLHNLLIISSVITFAIWLTGALICFTYSKSVKAAKEVLFEKQKNLTKFGQFIRFMFLIPGFITHCFMLFVTKLFFKD